MENGGMGIEREREGKRWELWPKNYQPPKSLPPSSPNQKKNLEEFHKDRLDNPQIEWCVVQEPIYRQGNAKRDNIRYPP